MNEGVTVAIAVICSGYSTILLYLVWSLNKKNTRLEGSIENMEGRMSAIFDNAPAEIYLKDKDGRYVMINPHFEELFGVKNSDVVGLLPTEIHEPELGAKTRAHDLLVLKQQKTVVRDELALTRLGVRTLHTVKFPTFNSLGELTGIGAIVTDVTDLREAEQGLRQSQKMEAIGHLTGGIAHDFNNLLAVILGNLELHSELQGVAEKTECISEAIDATIRGAELTKSLLSFAKKSTLSPEVLDLNNLVVETKKWSSRVLPENIDFEISASPNLLPVLADKSMTQAALLNVILNAKDAMPTGGKISIEISNLLQKEKDGSSDAAKFDVEHSVVVLIHDNGAGIDPETVESVFTPFFSTKPVGGGSGLGLSMVQGFMKQSGGSVKLSSELNVGTSVQLCFPALLSLPETTSDTENLPSMSLAKIGKLLIAEDDDNVRRWLVRCLEQKGHEVVWAASGDAAFSMFVEDPDDFDVLVSDILMPGRLQGPELANCVREIRPSFPVIFLSGYPRGTNMHGFNFLSGDVFLSKPVKSDELQEALDRSLTI